MNKKRIVKDAILIIVILVATLLIWRNGYKKGRVDELRYMQKIRETFEKIEIIEKPKGKNLTLFVRILDEQRYI